MGSAPERYTREETTAQRADRRWGELMQELRVTQTGVQVLVGFLFTVAFTNRFGELNGGQRVLYISTLVLGACATAVLIAPVSFHRILFGQRMKPELVRATNVLTLIGLGLLMCTISAALLLVFDFVLHGALVGWLAAAVAGSFILLWYVVPLWLRLRRDVEWEEDSPARARHEQPARARHEQPARARHEQTAAPASRGSPPRTGDRAPPAARYSPPESCGSDS